MKSDTAYGSCSPLHAVLPPSSVTSSLPCPLFFETLFL